MSETSRRSNVNEHAAAAEIKFMTWNIANFDTHKHWDARCVKIASHINFIQPDFVALQELRERWLPPRIALDDILNHLNGYYYYHYEPAAEYKVLGMFINTTEGLGILSRHPIISTRSTKLSPAQYDDNQRICLEVTLIINGTQLSVAVEHLTFDHTATRQQLVDVWNFLTPPAPQSNTATTRDNTAPEADASPSHHATSPASASQPRTPQLLLGDFNISCEDEHCQDFILGKCSYEGITGDFQDAAETLGLAYAQMMSFPSDCPDSALDRVLYRGPEGFEPVSYSVQDVVAEGELAPSDHLYVSCSFRLPGGSAASAASRDSWEYL